MKTKIGLDGKNTAVVSKYGPLGVLKFTHDQGLDGVFFRSILDLSPTLGEGELQKAKDYADELGLYLEVGVGRVNPYNTSLSPEIRVIGEGDYLLGMERMIKSAARIGCRELWGECATMSVLPGVFNIDRFRTDVSWSDQLDATQKFLFKLAPVLRDVGSRINLETHEEVSSFELVRMIETTGSDVLGITYDTANMLSRGEDPIQTTKRVAPFTNMTHLKDAALYFVDDGLGWQVRPCGQGVIPWDRIIPMLIAHSPNLNLTLEDSKFSMKIFIYNDFWQQMHPDLTISEFAEVIRLTRDYEKRIANGDVIKPEDYEKIPHTDEQRISRFQESAKLLRGIVERMEKEQARN